MRLTDCVGAMSEMTINLDLDKLPNNLKEIREIERFEESGSDVKVRSHIHWTGLKV